MENEVFYTYKDETVYMHHQRTAHPKQDDFTFRSHSHDMVELYYYVSGDVDFVVEGKIHHVTPGLLIVTDRGQMHNIRIVSEEEPYERIAILLHAKELPESAKRVLSASRSGECCFIFSEQDRIWVEQTLLMPEAAQMEEKSVILSAANLIFSRLDTMLVNRAPAQPIHTAEDSIVRDIISYINEHLTEDWNLDTLEKVFYHDKSYLNRRFKSIMGCGIWEYTLRKRIFSAQQWLYLSGSVAQSFNSSGFKDYSAFYRRYKKVIGCSPSEDLARIGK